MEHLHLKIITGIFLYSLCAPLHAYDGAGTLVSQGIQRSFIFHAPGDSVAHGLPLVLVFHGLGGNGVFIEQNSGFNAVADANNFIAVYPNATVIGGLPQWNAYVDEVSGHAPLNDPDATDDVIFVDDLIEWFCTEHAIDPHRIYATGHSNGGFMAYRLAIQRPTVIAAIAPVAGGLWGDQEYLTNYFLQDYEPIPVMHIHGDADAIVEYPDPNHDPNAMIWPLSFFALGNCGSTAYESEPITTNVHRLVFCDGVDPPGPEVTLVRLEGGDHMWPEMPGFHAATSIWEFFNGNSVEDVQFTCEMTSIFDHTIFENGSNIHPNPSNGILHLDVDADKNSNWCIRDLNGRLINNGILDGSPVNISDLSSGSYTIEMIRSDGGRSVSRFQRE